jgi:hypothetical protein
MRDLGFTNKAVKIRTEFYWILMPCCVVLCCGRIRTFQRSMWPPSSPHPDLRNDVSYNTRRHRSPEKLQSAFWDHVVPLLHYHISPTYFLFYHDIFLSTFCVRSPSKVRDHVSHPYSTNGRPFYLTSCRWHDNSFWTAFPEFILLLISSHSSVTTKGHSSCTCYVRTLPWGRQGSDTVELFRNSVSKFLTVQRPEGYD